MDALITKIMNFAQKLVDADRASLFLVSLDNSFFLIIPKKLGLFNNITKIFNTCKTVQLFGSVGKKLLMKLGSGGLKNESTFCENF